MYFLSKDDPILRIEKKRSMRGEERNGARELQLHLRLEETFKGKRRPASTHFCTRCL
jgi:hypothetical protein